MKIAVTILLTASLVLAYLLLFPSRPDPPQATPPDTPAKEAPVPPPRAELKLEESPDGISNVMVQRDERWVNLTRFERSQTVYDFDASPDGQYAFVWHMARSSRKVSVYDLETLERIAHFSPGYGGTLQWSAGNTLFHYWGAGTNVQCLVLYTSSGSKIMSDNGASVAVSPSRRFAAALCGGEVRILDLRSGGLVAAYKVPGGYGFVARCKWDGDAPLLVTDDGREGEDELIVLSFDPEQKRLARIERH